jgi:hypothetical protein
MPRARDLHPQAERLKLLRLVTMGPKEDLAPLTALEFLIELNSSVTRLYVDL